MDNGCRCAGRKRELGLGGGGKRVGGLSQEASFADISYLFDEGALIDFEVDELVGLVRALFADIHMWRDMIVKLKKVHHRSPCMFPIAH